jgi:L-amino acid N-acyltransferase YncA
MTVESDGVAVSRLTREHRLEVARIYAVGIATGSATFETEVPTWERRDAAPPSPLLNTIGSMQ